VLWKYVTIWKCIVKSKNYGCKKLPILSFLLIFTNFFPVLLSILIILPIYKFILTLLKCTKIYHSKIYHLQYSWLVVKILKNYRGKTEKVLCLADTNFCDASLLLNLSTQMLPTLAREKRTSLFSLQHQWRRKKFDSTDTWCQCYKNFCPCHCSATNKLECWSPASFNRDGAYPSVASYCAPFCR
jgi:hypothetical protein